MSKVYLKDEELRKRYGVSAMTIWRWRYKSPALEFPAPIQINGKNYTDEDELDAFDERQRAPQLAEAS